MAGMKAPLALYPREVFVFHAVWNIPARELDVRKKPRFAVLPSWEAESHQYTEETSLGRER